MRFTFFKLEICNFISNTANCLNLVPYKDYPYTISHLKIVDLIKKGSNKKLTFKLFGLISLVKQNASEICITLCKTLSNC